MTTGAPESKASSLISKLNELRDVLQTDEIRWRFLWQEAESLQRADAQEAFVIMGALYCMRGDAERSREYHDKALTGYPPNGWAHINYAASLGNLGLFEDALSHASKAMSLEGEDQESLDAAISLAIEGSYLSYAGQLYAMRDARFGEHEILLNGIRAVNGLMQNYGLSELQLRAPLYHAIDFLHINEISARHLGSEVVGEAADCWLTHKISVAAPKGRTTLDVQDEFFDLILEKDMPALTTGAVVIVFQEPRKGAVSSGAGFVMQMGPA